MTENSVRLQPRKGALGHGGGRLLVGDTSTSTGDTPCYNCGQRVGKWPRKADGKLTCNRCGLYYKVHKAWRNSSQIRPPGFKCADCDSYFERGQTTRRFVHGQYVCNKCGLYYKAKGYTRDAVRIKYPPRPVKRRQYQTNDTAPARRTDSGTRAKRSRKENPQQPKRGARRGQEGKAAPAKKRKGKGKKAARQKRGTEANKPSENGQESAGHDSNGPRHSTVSGPSTMYAYDDDHDGGVLPDDSDTSEPAFQSTGLPHPYARAHGLGRPPSTRGTEQPRTAPSATHAAASQSSEYSYYYSSSDGGNAEDFVPGTQSTAQYPNVNALLPPGHHFDAEVLTSLSPQCYLIKASLNGQLFTGKVHLEDTGTV